MITILTLWAFIKLMCWLTVGAFMICLAFSFRYGASIKEIKEWREQQQLIKLNKQWYD